MIPLIDRVRALLDEAVGRSPAPVSDRLRAARLALDEPLKVAVAGRVKAGKSTLVNALIGDEVAPTDAGECTRIVTWYRDGVSYRVEATIGSATVPLRFSRADGVLEIDLEGREAGEIDRLDVTWPTAALRAHTIIDTPGIGSIDTEVGAATTRFLTPEDERSTEADAVLYLMRHVHRDDIDFLEAFHDESVSRATPLNAIGVLSRADEIGVGRLDAVESAAAIAARYERRPEIRRLCAGVVPVAGLVAQAAAGLREVEYRALGALSQLPSDDLEPLLWSADRFREPDATVVLTGEERALLLERFGLFGIRCAVDALRTGRATSATGLAGVLLDASGLTTLRRRLDESFTRRRDLLKVRSALAEIEALAGAGMLDGDVVARAEEIRAGAHELTEARALAALRAGRVRLPEQSRDALERLLGADGDAAHIRLGLPADTPAADLLAAAHQELARQRSLAEQPTSSAARRELAGVAARTCEGLIFALGAHQQGVVR
ncbi:MAG: hypothetical protein D6683_01310 [Actinomyces sp.]|nr:MAG: hypothetical protein D6683_01310 [Actinomyces sp.]